MVGWLDVPHTDDWGRIGLVVQTSESAAMIGERRRFYLRDAG
jgi:hypothetical protein